MVKQNKSDTRNLVLDQTPDALIGLNEKNEIIDFNEAALKFFNLTEKELLVTDIRKLIPDNQLDSPPQRFETEAIKKGGHIFPVEVTSVKVSDQEGIFRYFILRNITLRKKITKELQLFTDTVENSLNAFDIVNAEGNFVYVNKTYVKMWGYDSSKEIIGTSAAGHCQDPNVPVQIITALKTKGECNIEFIGLRKDGSTFNVLMWARLAHDPDGNEIYPTTSIDITDRVTAASEKSRLQEQLELAVKARDEFISICSHELKTPITSMKLQFQLTQRQIQNHNTQVLSEEATARRVGHAIKQLDRMTMLIDDMLDVSKIASKKLSLNLERLNFQEIVSDVIERFQEIFASYNVPVETSVPPEELFVMCDRYRIEQVIQNLLTNAIKYGKGNIVKVKTFAEDKKVFLKVEDQGMGIQPENISKIFDRYERVIGASEISGLGLGLYISRQIIELHHGHIHVTSTVGRGSVFTVELPLQY